MFVLPDRFARYDNSDSPWGRMPDHGSENMEELKRHKVLSFTQKLREITGYIQMVDIKYDNDDEKLDELDFQLESLGQLFPSLQVIRTVVVKLERNLNHNRVARWEARHEFIFPISFFQPLDQR